MKLGILANCDPTVQPLKFEVNWTRGSRDMGTQTFVFVKNGRGHLYSTTTISGTTGSIFTNLNVIAKGI